MYEELLTFLQPVEVTIDHVSEWKKVCQLIEEAKIKQLPRKSLDQLVYSRLFSVIGLRGLQSISRNFYERVWGDEDWFRGQFVNANPMEEEIVNQWTFFVQFLGGPAAFELWRSRFGEGAMLLKHSLFEMTDAMMTRWLKHMAMAAQSALEGQLYMQAPAAVEYFLRYCKSFRSRLLS
jgi:truncated hemoglobin YjbI